MRPHRHCEPTGRANARPMTGSAKQSIWPRKERMDCFVASRLAMTTGAPIGYQLPHHFAAALRDQPRGALVAHIDPQPADGDAEPVAQADQEVDVGDTPDPPCQGAAQFYPSEIDH